MKKWEIVLQWLVLFVAVLAMVLCCGKLRAQQADFSRVTANGVTILTPNFPLLVNQRGPLAQDITLGPVGTATSGQNQNSHCLNFAGSLWTGASASDDLWTICSNENSSALSGGADLTLNHSSISGGAGRWHLNTDQIMGPPASATPGGNFNSFSQDAEGSYWDGSTQFNLWEWAVTTTPTSGFPINTRFNMVPLFTDSCTGCTADIAFVSVGSGALSAQGNYSGAPVFDFLIGASGQGQELAPAGTVAAPSLSFIAESGSGWYRAGSGDFRFSVGGNDHARIEAGDFTVASGDFIRWGSGGVTGADTCFFRVSSDLVGVGNCAAADTSGKMEAAGFISKGTTFTASGCTNSALVGGATAGKFTVGQATACTIVITMGNSATAPNGWHCRADDETAAPAVAIRQTAHTTTSCSLTMTVATNDQIVFSAEGW